MRSSGILASQFPLVRSFISHKHASSVVIFLCHREGKLSPVTLHAEEFTENPEVPCDVTITVSTQRPYSYCRSNESKTWSVKCKKENRFESQILGNVFKCLRSFNGTL